MQVKQKWTNVSVVTPDGVIDHDLLVEDDRFAGFVAPGTATSPDWQQIDGAGQVLYPGILDILQHGFDIYLYNDVAPGCVAHVSRLLPAHGVTGFLPSISSLPPKRMEAALIGLAMECGLATGARALGLHSEGPCFASPGAHNPEYLQVPSNALAESMLSAADGKLKAVTVAPELPGAQGFIETLKRAGVSIHLGHSQALPEDIPRYVGWGIDAVTHVYNVMPGLAPNDQGVPVFSLADALIAKPGLHLGLICDGIHVHPKLVQLLSHLPPDRVFLETDAIKYAGGPDKEFEFYPGYWVRSARGQAVRDRNGGLCGSSLTPHEAMLNYRSFSGKGLAQIAHATSLVPARVLGMDADLGSIEAGKLADFAVLDPDTLAVNATYIGGKPVYRRAS